MFGYVRPFKAFMLVKEYDEYKGIYCTLCRTLGKRYNVFTRMALNYDLTFYTVLLLNDSDECPSVRQGKCVVNPLKKCNYICENNEAYNKAAALTVLMTYHKIIDNIKDDSFIKSIASRSLMPFIKGSAKKAKSDYPDMASALENMTEEQNELEDKYKNGKKVSLDACCEPTAKALSKIFSEINKDEEMIYSQMGYFLGRWIYIMDAADDLKDDLASNSFNPLIDYFSIKEKMISEDNQKEVDETANQILNNNVAMLVSANNLLDESKFSGITHNIVEQGLAQVQKEILFLHVHEKKKKEKFKDKF